MEGPRLVRREEANDLCDLLCSVFGFDGMYAKDRFCKALRRRAHFQGGMVMMEQGKPVSHILSIVDEVSIHGCRVKVASMGGVCTHPDYRGRGYAGRVLEESLRLMAERGARILIVSGDRSLYRRNHCVPAGQVLGARIARDRFPPGIGGDRLTVRRVGSEEWGLLSPIHLAEPVRFVRSSDHFERCCAWWDCGSPEIWSVALAGEALAYLSLAPPWGEPDRPRRTVGEYAGSRAAMLDALPAIFEQTGVAEIHFKALGHDAELAYLMQERGVSLLSAPLPGTHRLLNLPGLMGDLRSYLAARLPRRVLRGLKFSQNGETCGFALDDERAEMDLSQAVQCVLGGPDAPRFEGALGRALGAVLPIPFPMPGFNYL